MLRRLDYVLLVFALIGSVSNSRAGEARLAEPQTIPLEETSESIGQVRATFNGSYVVFSRSSDTLTLLGLGGGLQYAINTRWGLGLGIRQGFSSSGFAGVFTEVGINAAYALSGSLTAERHRLLQDGKELSSSIRPPPPTWVLRAFVSQYLVNGSASTLPYSAIGVGVSYDFLRFSTSSVGAGLRVDRMTNGTKSFFPVSFYLSWDVWFSGT